MATIYRRRGSPYWWIKFRKYGKIIQESTHLRHAMSFETKKARELCTERNLEEIKEGGGSSNDKFSQWVLIFFEQMYSRSAKTLQATRCRWNALTRYFESINIIIPRQITYSTSLDYLTWRQKDGASRNTAMHEIGLLRFVMGEAVKRGMCQVNPCARMGIKRDKPKEKPEISDEEITKIRNELDRIDDETGERAWPEWMKISFEIAIHQGCRLRETSVPFRDIDFDRQTITFNAKGSKRFTTALHPGLHEYLQLLENQGKSTTCELPVMPSKFFHTLFTKLHLKHLCFHCTRVTVVTRLARAGVPMSQAMRFVGHSSHIVHRIYQRLSVDDLGHCLSALTYNPTHKNPGDPASTEPHPAP